MIIVARMASAAALIAVLLLPAVAEAQEQRLSISVTPAIVSVGGDGEFGVGTSVGYRFSDHFSFEGDFTWVDGATGIRDGRIFADAEPTLTTGILGAITGGVIGSGRGDGRNVRGIPFFDRGTALPITSILPGSASFDGSTMIGTLGVRYEPMVETERFRPFLSAGLGLNYTDQEFIFESTPTRPGIPPIDFDQPFSHTGMAFSAGGGANFRLVSSLWVNVDAKYFRLSRDRNLMRLGGGITLKF